MLEMTINKEACDGCRLCLDVCPTECFSLNEETGKAEVAQLENCIACLSCCSICPTVAIAHKNHYVAANFLQQISSGPTMPALQATAEDHDKAFNEVCFLLDALVDAIERFVGKATPSLAVAAGRKIAGNLPISLSEPTTENALAELVRVFTRQQMEIEGEMQGKEAIITIAGCPIGQVCRQRDMAIDGSACQMFHYYLSGIMAELTGRMARPKTIAAGDTCSFSLAFAGGPR